MRKRRVYSKRWFIRFILESLHWFFVFEQVQETAEALMAMRARTSFWVSALELFVRIFKGRLEAFILFGQSDFVSGIF